MRVLVIGGTGTMSLHTVQVLHGAGHAVTMLNRRSSGPNGVAVLHADRHDPHQLTAVLAGHRFDAVIDMMCFTAEQARMLVEALPQMGHLIFCSTVCALGFGWTTWPVPENSTPNPHSNYGIGKAAAEAWYTEWSQRSGIPLTIVRPSTTFDGRIGLLRQLCWDGSAWLARIRDGKPIALCDSGMATHQFMYAEDAGHAFALMAGNPAAHGRIAHLVGATTCWAEHARAAMRALGTTVELVSIPAAILDHVPIPGDGIRRDIFQHHASFTPSAWLSELGWQQRFDLDQAVAQTCEALAASKRIISDTNSSWEDELIARWGT